jgi:hypothetical protein
MTDALRRALDRTGWHPPQSAEHLAIVRRIRSDHERGDTTHTGELVLRAALLRRFLG